MWPELSIARVWPEAHQLPLFAEYMPSEWSLANSKKIERNFFFGILISLAPEYVEQVVLDIRSQRLNQQAGRVVRPQSVNVSNEWVDNLLSQPFMSTNRKANSSMMIVR